MVHAGRSRAWLGPVALGKLGSGQPTHSARSFPSCPHPPKTQARRAYDDAGAGGEGWWDAFSDRVACAWDDAKCRVKEGLGMSAVSAALLLVEGCS